MSKVVVGSGRNRSPVCRSFRAGCCRGAIIRREVAKLLGDAQAVKARAPLLVLIEDEDSDVRKNALQSLGRVGDSSCIPAILKHTDDNNYFVKREAEKAVKALHDREPLPDAPPEPDPDSPLERLAVAVLSGGTSARLFTEVRQKRSLCYSVSAAYQAGRDRGLISLYAGTTPQRAGQTLEVCLEEIRRLILLLTKDIERTL